MSSDVERKASNEHTFRDANEQLQAGAVCLVEGDQDPVPFLCECSRAECTEVVLLTLAEYERVRSGSRRGVAKPGHEDLSIERVLDQNDRFTVTEKFGAAGEMYGQSDPRT